jgi:hypothetical protein
MAAAVMDDLVVAQVDAVEDAREIRAIAQGAGGHEPAQAQLGPAKTHDRLPSRGGGGGRGARTGGMPGLAGHCTGSAAIGNRGNRRHAGPVLWPPGRQEPLWYHAGP